MLTENAEGRPHSIETLGREVLERNNESYERMLDFVRAPEAWPCGLLATIVEQIADFAAANHPGRFADGTLENPLLHIGSSLNKTDEGSSRTWRHLIPIPGKELGRRNILHMATRVHSIGGQTRTIKNWVKDDPHS